MEYRISVLKQHQKRAIQIAVTTLNVEEMLICFPNLGPETCQEIFQLYGTLDTKIFSEEETLAWWKVVIQKKDFISVLEFLHNL